MPRSHIDHLVVTAASLEEGADYVRRELGIEMQAGGEHARMGTHNRLLKLGDKLYLEVIAANPAVPRPDRPRWFQLDEPDSVKAPRLATWVARCDYIHALAPAALGKIETMTRGSLRWLITVPEDGKLPLQGIAPALIEWRSETHPAQGLKDLGCSLVRLEGSHPRPEEVTAMLRSIGFDGDFPVSRGEARLAARILTPAGERRL
ncbi:MAG TPA: VOC family protein [Burkholderiales bacterium]|nr:VOC family protein [Burkholderiales bacterium]